jgi:pantoate kinase
MVDIEIVVPISISGVWKPIYTNEPETTGSIGLALVLEPPIVASIKKGSGIIIYNNQFLREFPNLQYLRLLGDLKVEVESILPLGYGYGISSALSLSYALGAYELGLTELKKALVTAHISEVLTKNGLGDVIVQWSGGGLVYRKKAGAPGLGEVEKIDVSWKSIFSIPIERMSTSKIIKEIDAKEYINEFLKERTLEKFFLVAKKFTEKLGFISPYQNSFRKKGIIVFLGKPPSDKSWIIHNPAKYGAFVR